VTICVSNYIGDNCCAEWLSTMEVKFCEATSGDHFYVYKLKRVPYCDMAYCAEKAPITDDSKLYTFNRYSSCTDYADRCYEGNSL